jgi:tetratricopeptide (TPR) repeat protein
MGLLQVFDSIGGKTAGLMGGREGKRFRAEGHIELGIEMAARQQLDQALAEFKKAAATCPQMAEAHFNIGLTYFRQGQHSAAVSAFTEATSVDPEYIEAYYNLGLAYVALAKQRLGEGKDVKDIYDKARRACLAAIRLRRDCVEALDSLGQVYYELGAHTEAFKAWYRALEVRRDYVPTYKSLIRLHLDRGETQSALVLSEQLVRIDPTAGELHNYVLAACGKS